MLWNSCAARSTRLHRVLWQTWQTRVGDLFSPLLPSLFFGEELNAVWCGLLWWDAQGMGAWGHGAERGGGCDMAGPHQSKGRRGQTFSCPWLRTPGGAGLMAARSKPLAPAGQKPAPAWKMWIEGLLCPKPGAMRSEKSDLFWELDCVWTLSLSQPVGQHRLSGQLRGVAQTSRRRKNKRRGTQGRVASSFLSEKGRLLRFLFHC